MTMGERFKRARHQRGLSLRALEAQTGVSRAIISKLEHDTHRWVSLEVAKQLARALGVTLDYLAGMYEADTPPRPAAEADGDTPAA